MTIPRPGHWPGLLLTGLAHLAALYFLLQSQRPADTPRGARNAVQWLLPLPKAETPRAVATTPPRKKTPPTAPGHSAPSSVPVVPTTTAANDGAPAAAAAPATTPAAAPYDPFAQPAAPARAPSADSIQAQARLDAGKIDKELRKTFPVAEPLPPPGSKQARLQRGFDAAHDAVPPKWYQGARMVELTTPDGENKVRTYKIITAVVTYCINIYPDGRKSYSIECPR